MLNTFNQTLPEYSTDKNNKDLPCWSGKVTPPAVGECIDVICNGIGPALVRGYTEAEGWLGVLVTPLNPPEWYVRQNGYNTISAVYGAEIGSIIPVPEIPGPNQEQLAALQEYANRHGENWKQKLDAAWMDGADSSEMHGHLLRQVRNNDGPGWLHSDENPITPNK